MTRTEKSWIAYDVANSVFALVVVTAIMPIFFKEVAAQGMPPQVSTAWWGYANSFSSALLMVLAPVMGALADYQGWKKRLFILFLSIGILATAMLSFSGPGSWVFCLVVFVVARTGWAGANVLYDAFITDVTTPSDMHRVSTAGFGWGYIGSVIPFLIVIALIMGMQVPGEKLSIPVPAAQIGFVVVALWWLLFSIPLLRNVHQTHFCPPSSHPVKEAFLRLATTLRHLREHRDAFLFLLAYFFFIDGIDTVTTMSIAYGVDIGLGSATLIVAVLVIQIVAFPCALLWGRLTKRFAVKTLLQTGITIYGVITIIAFMLPSFTSVEVRTGVFWLISLLVATSMGGIQALSRSFFGRLVPVERSAEFFGFYNIFGKFAAISGPFLVGAIGQLTGHTRYGVLSILVLLAAGSVILTQVRELDLPPQNASG